ncbi:MAG: starch-binding protein [Ruminococcus sp.]|nr:starch-binding protein [Ruminococcus sp.]
MKISKKLLAIILAVVLIVSTVAVAAVSVNAAAGDKVYCRASFTPNCYMWKKNTEENNHAWPGVAMTKVAGETDVYVYTVPADKFDMIIFNGSGQTTDMSYPGGNKLYDFATNKWEDYSSDPVPVITVSKDGGGFKGSVDVTITVTDADSAYYTVDNGAQVAINGTATVKIGANSPEGASIKLDISATNSYGTTTKSCTFKKRSSTGPATDGSTSDPVGGNYATNPNNGYGKRKTITVDGDKSDWEQSMLIAQGVANDDPRVYAGWSMHEIAFDDYAMYAAWDDTNLYIMYEMANVQDVVASGEDYPMTQGNLWINNIPVFLYIFTGNGNITHGETAGGTLWNSGNTLDAHADHVVAYSTNATNGPFIFTADDDGLLDADNPDLTIARADTGINIKWGNGKTLSGTLMGISKAGKSNRTPGDCVDGQLTDFYSKGHKASMDMFYEMSIPLAKLDISASDIETNGIGVLKISTFGTSGMDCLPYDLSMCDNAAKPYSADSSTSMEKEDEDHITVPMARVGKAFTPGAVQPPTEAQIQPTDPPVIPTDPPVIPTEPPVIPTEPPVDIVLGDADDDGDVSVLDATYIQRSEANIALPSPLNERNADVDGDEDVTILDATYIQRFVAGIIKRFPAQS